MRERANSLKAQADELLRKADALLAEAEQIETNAIQKKCGETKCDKDQKSDDFRIGGQPPKTSTSRFEMLPPHELYPVTRCRRHKHRE